jgi:phosphoribosylaminoimidazole-succinocarboxamide synthase
MPNEPLVSLDLPGIAKLRSGKVREVFDLGETLLFVATDRLSAFDVILPNPIPDKGAVLNLISAFWFERIQLAENHLITADFTRFPAQLIIRRPGKSAAMSFRPACNWPPNYRRRSSLPRRRTRRATT